MVGGTVLNNDDCRKLQDAALKTLEHLYSTELRHKNLVARNIRVSKRWTKLRV